MQPGEDVVAYLAIAVEPRLAAALDDVGVEGRPVFDFASHGARELDRPVVRLGREGDDQVVGAIFELVEGLAPVVREAEADFLDHRGRERVELALVHADAVDIDAPAMHVLQHGLGHG